MGRTPDDPSGAKITLCLTLSPHAVAKLTEAAGTTGISRSAIVEKLIGRLATKETPTP